MARDLSRSLGAFSLAKSLKWRHRRHRTQVAECVSAALAGEPSAVLLVVGSKPPVMVSARLVALPPAPMVPPEHRVALQLVPLSEPAPLPPAVLQTLYGLTPSEARLAHALAARRKLADAARESGLSATTARTYLKKIFLKTGTSRQAQLVRLLWVKSGFLA